MGTFADQARDKAKDIGELCQRLRLDVAAAKGRCHDRQALDLLTLLQAELLLIGVDCAQLRSSLSAAISCHEFKEREPDPRFQRAPAVEELAKWIDRKRAAGGDSDEAQPELLQRDE